MIVDETPGCVALRVEVRCVYEIARAAKYRSNNAAEVASSAPQPHSVPNVIVPRHSGLTQSLPAKSHVLINFHS